MQWVKASERLPEVKGDYFVNWQDHKKVMYWDGEHFSANSSIYTDETIEWLEASIPFPVEEDELWKEGLEAFSVISTEEEIIRHWKQSFTIKRREQ